MTSIGRSDKQWSRLIDRLSTDDDMRQGYCDKPNGTSLLSRKWDEFAVNINEAGPAKKNGEKWKEVSTQYLCSKWFIVHWSTIVMCYFFCFSLFSGI